ncbi:hypothetical protein MKX01_040417 [Papaver californicum]|nr:hypothetical protein MKX01_040417 [Papaver californicum]
MSSFFKKLAKSALVACNNMFNETPKSSIGKLRVPTGTVAAVSGGLSNYLDFSPPNVAHLNEFQEESGSKFALNPDKWIKFELQDTARVNHNSHLFRFSFDPSTKLGFDVASCILTRAPAGLDDNGKTEYVLHPDSESYFDLLVKFYPDGKMSQHLGNLKPGDVIEVKGPKVKLGYTPNMKKHIGTIAGGSGITPMLQVIDAILKNPDDKTQMSLLYANISPDDILLKQKLDVLSANYIYYTVENPTNNWKGGKGYITQNMVDKGMPSPSEDTLILVCGPPGLMNHIFGDKVSGILKELGYTKEMVHKF